ncbi:MAG: TolC family protein [Bacteroidota bacterium]
MNRKNIFLFFIILLFIGSSSLLHAQTKNLDFYISTGIQNSPLLKDYTNQILSNQLDSSLIKAGLKPQVNLTSQAMYAPYYKYFGYDTTISNGGNYTGLVGVTQSLLIKNIKAKQFENINLQNQSLTVNSKITESDLKKTITTQYLTAYSDFSQVQFNQTVLQQLKDEQTVVKQLVESGIYLQTDYLNISVSIKSQHVAIHQAALQFRNDLNTLNLLCGIVDTATVSLSAPSVSLKNNFDINNSPAMMQFRIDSLKNTNDKFLIDLNYKPKLEAFADAGFMAIRPQFIQRNFGASVGLNFSVPIYDGGQRKLQNDKILLEESTRQNYQSFYTTQYQQQLNQLKQELKMTDDLIVQIKNQLTEQLNLIDLYKTEIEKGLVRFSDYILTVNSYKDTQNNLTQTEMSRLQIINEMNYLK